MRQLTPAHAVLVAVAATIGLLLYVFGVPTVLAGALWVLVGAVVGWIGSLVMPTRTQQDILFDISAGAAGALGGLLLFGTPIGGGGPLEQFFAAVVGSVLIVAAVGIARGWRPSQRSFQRTEPES